MAKSKGRGSVKLFGTLPPSKAKAFQSAMAGFRIVDWHELGKPTPEIISGAFAGKPGRVGSLVDRLMKIKEVREMDILINGTPKPDIAQVRFQMRVDRP